LKAAVADCAPDGRGGARRIVVASENSSPEAALVLKLPKAGQEVLLPISENGARQVQMVLGEFSRSRDLLFVEDTPAVAATLQ
jgi:hypothetical protein